MKKIILISGLVLLCLEMYAQTEKEVIFLGGQVYFVNSSTDASDNMYKNTNRYINLQVLPSLGLFIKDNLALGITLTVGNSTSKNIFDPVDPVLYGNTNTTTTMYYGVGVFLRSYSKIADRFYFSLNGLLNYTSQPGTIKSTTEDPGYVYPPTNPATQYTRGNNWGISLTPGLDYFISPHFGMRATFGNLYLLGINTKNITLQNDNKQMITSYGLNLNISSFTFGMNYYF